MKLCRLFFLATGVWVVFLGISPALAQTIDGPIARNHLRRTVKKMLYQEKFTELEKMALEFRRTRARFPDGSWKLLNFYVGLAFPNEKTAAGWETHLAKVDKWLQKSPDTITAKVAAGYAWYYYGYDARGEGSAASVTEEGWRLLKERGQKALSFLEKKPARREDDCPGRYGALLVIALGGGRGEKFNAIFDEAVAREPAYFSYYQLKATYLLPKWHGETGDWQKFANDAIALTPPKEGKSIYVRILQSLWETKDFRSFDEPGISWSVMKQGFIDLERNYPNSPWNLNTFCKFACVVGDKETARKLFRQIGERPYIEAWGDFSDFVKWREWAGLGGKNDDKSNPLFPAGTEDVRQTLQLANKGDAEAQHNLGLYYERGEQVARNYVEAAKWFRKAADQEHSEAMMSLGRQYENGFGAFERNYAEAAKWYHRAAMLGNDYGANSMGRTYLHGIGVEKDPIKAYVWFSQRKVWKDEYPKEIEVKLTKEHLKQAELEANKLREQIRTNREAAERR